MGFPVIFEHKDKSTLLAAVGQFCRCMRQNKRRVTPWPMLARNGAYQITVDVCGQYDPDLTAQCSRTHGMTHQHVDLRKYSPGKVEKVRGQKRR